jgi:hypothetical protein
MRPMILMTHFGQDTLLQCRTFHDAHMGVAGDWDILCSGDCAPVLADEIYRVRHSPDLARGCRVDANHDHVVGATGRRLGRDSCRRLGAKGMANDNNPVCGMGARIGRKGPVLRIAAVGDDVAARPKSPSDRGEAGADIQAVHYIGAGSGRNSVLRQSCEWPSRCCARKRFDEIASSHSADFRLQQYNYSRDLRPAKWGSGVSVQGSNSESLMSASGHKRTLERLYTMSALTVLAQCDPARLILAE